MTSPDPPQDAQAKLLQAAVDDREAHPWRYYRFSPGDYKKALERLVDVITALRAEVGRLHVEIARLKADDERHVDNQRSSR